MAAVKSSPLRCGRLLVDGTAGSKPWQKASSRCLSSTFGVHPGSGSPALDGPARSPFILTRILSIPPSPEKLPGAATTYRPPFHPPGRNNISEGSYTPSQRPLNKRRKNNPSCPLRSGQGGIKKEDIKTGTYRNDMFPLMSIFFFLPRLFNGLCRRGVCPSRRLLLQFHHYFSSGALVLVVPHARRVEHSLACDRHR